MNNFKRRNLSPADRLVAGLDHALATLTGTPRSTGRAYPAAHLDDTELEDSERRHAAGLMRVNHAGEIAAQGLYQGQALTARLNRVREQMEQAAMEEFDHLEWCRRRLEELDSAPSRLAPVWYSGSFAIGAAAGLAGDRWSLGFVAETERQVVTHLQSHFSRLPAEDHRSQAIITQMEIDEGKHARDATAAGGAEIPAPIRRIMQWVAKIMTTTAYRV